MFKLIFSNRAANKLRKLPWKRKEQLEIEIDELKEIPFIAGKPLARELTGFRRLKVGVYRVIYKVSEKDRLVTIMDIHHRAMVYS